MIDIEQQLREAALDLPADAPPVAERAGEEGLLDVAYSSVDSPLGPLVVAATPQGLVRVSYSEFRGEDEVLEKRMATLGLPPVLHPDTDDPPGWRGAAFSPAGGECAGQPGPDAIGVRAGEDGWELVQVVPGPGGGDQLVAYLKRPKA